MTSSGSANLLLHMESDDTFISYDIPLHSCLGDTAESNREDPTIFPNFNQTTRFIENSAEIQSTNNLKSSISQPLESKRTNTFSMNDDLHISHSTSNNPSSESSADREVTEISHGFIFGAQSIPNLTVIPATDKRLELDNTFFVEDDLEDEGISEVYGWNNKRTADIRQSDRSFKNSPETPRHAISQRIAQVGLPGHHIGLGHRLGLLKEDVTLIPNRVTVTPRSVLITEDSPVQIEISWSKPDNLSNFKSLLYKVEISSKKNTNSKEVPGIESPASANVNNKTDDNIISNSSSEWINVAATRWPIFRIYHTDDKLFIGKERVMRRDGDVVIDLRIGCYGEFLLPGGFFHGTMGPFSKTVTVTFQGYTYTPFVEQQTSL